MPVQPTLFGRAISGRRLPPRRFLVVFALIASLAIYSLVQLLPSSYAVPSAPSVGDLSGQKSSSHLHRPKFPKLSVPSIHNPFRQAAHEPPVQANSTSGEASWFSDWKWLNPFSSSITLDENRAVLPPLRPRPPIYTFYDPNANTDSETRDAESKLLLAWRRAWWAQGFRPAVLGRAESMKNPMYESLQLLRLEPDIEEEMARWLAWGHMGAGILASHLAFPMASYDEALLSYLRRGDYPKLTRYEGLGSGLFCGDQNAINAAIKQALANPELRNSKSIVDSLPKATFDVDPNHDSIALYDAATVASKYKPIAEKITGTDAGSATSSSSKDKEAAAADSSAAASPAEGLQQLVQLINSHLHLIFQNNFYDGIQVLKPWPLHTTALVEPAYEIAQRLAECSFTPMQSSCPPNRPRCKPCLPTHPMQVTTPESFFNTSTKYIIGTVPHPYTLLSLAFQREQKDITTRFVRRDTDRDVWLMKVTKELTKAGGTGSSRVVHFKDSVASTWGAAHSYWLTGDTMPMDSDSASLTADVDWHFGFVLPRPGEYVDAGTSETPVPGPERRPQPPKPKIPPPSTEELAKEKAMLAAARQVLKSNDKKLEAVKAMVEAWNLADAEAWRFARAFAARANVERAKWEEDEKNFAGTESRGIGWGRWFDRRTQ
ncbi:hypothetical protein L228DRAFT_250331 [Xylona heveae TC161]|uniref:Uncharacterized protein n=1 Tax=Xylona heveae (strain CBS 132557 / TC161) TaxID=1328760 RepID=A0A165A3W1_XYLHT|nr:hypothetical protein L228DRAFT_250331 [Xylona heveae TC161]KZF19914.1 hypothetical protein L228DRAFT_250331 [Xylona heveae TC161]